MANVTKAGAAYEAILVDKVTGKVDDVIDSLERLEAAFKQLNGPAKSVAKTMDTIGDAMSEMRKRSSRSGASLQKVGQIMSNLQSTINNAGQAIGQSMIHIGNQMRNVGLLATAAATGIGAMFYKSAKAVSSFDEQMSRFNVTFGNTAGENLKWADEFAKKVGRSKTATIAGLSSFRGLFGGLDLPKKQLDEMAQTMQSASVDFASFIESSDEEGMHRMLQALSGSMEAVRQFGIDVSENSIKQFGEDMGFATKNLSQQEKLMLRYLSTVQQLKKLDVFGDAERTAGSLANQTKRLQSAFTSLATEVGTILRPTFESIVRIGNGLVGVLKGLAEVNVGKMVGLMVTLGSAGAGLVLVGSALAAAGPPLMAMASVAASIIGAVGSLITMAAVGGPVGIAIAAIGTAVTGAAAVFTFFTLKSLDLRKAFTDLSEEMGAIGDRFRDLATILEAAMMEKDWALAWDAIAIAGEITFRRLGAILYDVIVEAMKQGFEDSKGAAWSFLKFVAKYASVGGYAMSAAMDAANPKIDDGSKKSWSEKQPALIADLEQRYRDMAVNATNALAVAGDTAGSDDMMAAMAKKKAGMRAAVDAMRNAANEPAVQTSTQINAASVGGFASTFAANTSAFSPTLSPLKKIEKGQERLIEETQKQTKFSKMINDSLDKLGTPEFQ